MSDCLEDMAAALELRLVRRFADGVFGAALVRDAQGRELVLKAQPRPELEPAWATGAAMAARLRTDGYPSPRYEAVGRTAHAETACQILRLASMTATHTPAKPPPWSQK